MDARASADRLVFVPPTAWGPTLNQPVTRNLVVTAAGLFPRAAGHICHRPQGIPEAVLLACVDGSGWLTMAGLTHQVGPNQAVFLPADQPYSYGADPERSSRAPGRDRRPTSRSRARSRARWPRSSR